MQCRQRQRHDQDLFNEIQRPQARLIQLPDFVALVALVAGKQAERERKEKEQSKREKEIAHHQAFVDRFRAKATKARQAQSKVKQMERIVIERLPPSSRRYPSFRFTQRRPSGKQVLEPKGIWYTPTTGIWQSVWLEAVPETYVARLVPRPDLAAGRALAGFGLTEAEAKDATTGDDGAGGG